MRIYDQKDSKRTVSCAYCHREGHNKRHCPHLKAHYQANKNFNPYQSHDPKGVDITMFPERFRRYYSEKKAIRQFRAFFSYAKSVHGEVAMSTPKKRNKPKCGFCGKRTHNRRNCKDMKAFVKLLGETNGAYRELFYDNIIEPLGLGIGAFVETGYVEYSSEIGDRQQHLISRFDLDNIGIGNQFHQWCDYAQSCMIGFAGSDRHYINFGGRNGLLTRDLFDAKGVSRKLEFLAINNWGKGISEIIAPAPSIPTKEWFLGQNPAFSWVVKKKNLNILWSEYRSLVNRYHPNGAKEFEKWEKKLF